MNSAAEFVAELAQLKRKMSREIFYRGHANKDWKLIPSLLRRPEGLLTEDKLFRDMVAHEPQSFSECTSALDYLVKMQHYGLPTRLLDLTMNPLVSLYFACEKAEAYPVDGAVYLFSVPEAKVKHYDSDTVSVLANLAKCKWSDLNLSFYSSYDLEGSFYDALRNVLPPKIWEKNRQHEAVCLARSICGRLPFLRSFALSSFKNATLAKMAASTESSSWDYIRKKNPYRGANPWVEELCKYILLKVTYPAAKAPYLEWFNSQRGMVILLHQIRGEKPHFQPSIQPYDLVNISFVKAKNDNQRIINQSGAFLLFGLGLDSGQDQDGYWGPLYCNKGKVATVPDEWIKRKFIIPADKKAKIRRELANLGITDSFIYPGIEQYAKELKQRYKL